MKLVVSVIDEQIAAGLIEKLVEKGIKVTKLTSSGGLLRKGNTTLLSGVEDDEVQMLVHIIKDYTERKKLEKINDPNQTQKLNKQGMATIFVMPVEKMIQL